MALINSSKQAPHSIPEATWNSEAIELINSISVGHPRNSDVKKLFELYNDRFLPKETGTSCSGCRDRVYKRMKARVEWLKEQRTLDE